VHSGGEKGGVRRVLAGRNFLFAPRGRERHRHERETLDKARHAAKLQSPARTARGRPQCTGRCALHNEAYSMDTHRKPAALRQRTAGQKLITPKIGRSSWSRWQLEAYARVVLLLTQDPTLDAYT
jgi:hypothetical protein